MILIQLSIYSLLAVLSIVMLSMAHRLAKAPQKGKQPSTLSDDRQTIIN